ncbi:MAG TPA: DegT/DnrJ/EryC1/StrS family aminotransferase [Candidatus Krumholzibacteria bacterium]|nr:DegT/DnrJ/EryC1/StrS family aminotransferase [Candidatus Krumholzibacteria bacterium]
MGQKLTVPFLDLSLQHRALRDEIDAVVQRTLDRGDFILGSALGDFEQEFARYCDCEHAIGVSSGTAALHLALVALGVGPGDEVVTVPNSFIATVESILYTGATAVLADVDPDTFCLDPALLERAITPRTKAIIPVHLYGQPCDMESIMAIASRHGIAVVEDACQAHGATFVGRKMGSFGHAAAFSFYPTKNLGTIGDGGALTTNDADIAARVRALRHHGQFEPNVFPTLGYNYRLDTMKAAVLSVKLAHLDRWNQRRREIADYMMSRLKGTEFVFQHRVPGSEPVFHILAAKHPRQRAVQDALTAAGIGWGRHIVTPAHRQPGYEHVVRKGEKFPVSEALSTQLVSLPVFPELADEQVAYVADVLSRVEVSV